MCSSPYGLYTRPCRCLVQSRSRSIPRPAISPPCAADRTGPPPRSVSLGPPCFGNIPFQIRCRRTGLQTQQATGAAIFVQSFSLCRPHPVSIIITANIGTSHGARSRSRRPDETVIFPSSSIKIASTSGKRSANVIPASGPNTKSPVSNPSAIMPSLAMTVTL